MSETAQPSSALDAPDRQRGMTLALVGSLAVHVLLVGALAVASLWSPAKIELSQKPISAKLVRLGAKRDKHLLPRKEVAPPAPPKVVEVPRPVPVQAKAPVAAPNAKAAPDTRTKLSDAFNRSRLFNAFDKAAAPAQPEEPIGDPEGDPEGDSDTADEGERYFGIVLAKARRNYGITKTISAAELRKLKVTVVVYIGSNGDLLKDPEVQISSGNERFDQDVLLSLRKAAPFGPPPQHLAEALKTVGVAFEATPF